MLYWETTGFLPFFIDILEYEKTISKIYLKYWKIYIFRSELHSVTKLPCFLLKMFASIVIMQLPYRVLFLHVYAACHLMLHLCMVCFLRLLVFLCLSYHLLSLAHSIKNPSNLEVTSHHTLNNNEVYFIKSLTHSCPMHPFSSPRKHQKTVGFSDVAMG